MVINATTSDEGASNVMQGGYVTYSNAQKVIVGVPEDVIERFRVYSPECAEAMARTVQELMQSDTGIGITGVVECGPKQHRQSAR